MSPISTHLMGFDLAVQLVRVDRESWVLRSQLNLPSSHHFIWLSLDLALIYFAAILISQSSTVSSYSFVKARRWQLLSFELVLHSDLRRYLNLKWIICITWKGSILLRSYLSYICRLDPGKYSCKFQPSWALNLDITKYRICKVFFSAREN